MPSSSPTPPSLGIKRKTLVQNEGVFREQSTLKEMEHGASINDASVLDKFDVRISFDSFSNCWLPIAA
jgi:hypothetical protein